MKPFALFLAAILLTAAAPAARAQVVHAATARATSLSVGGTFSLYQPDYLGGFTAQSNGLSLRYGLAGVGVYADFKLTRWIQLEAETRWLRYNKNQIAVTKPSAMVVQEVGEDTYLIGPRVPVRRFGRFSPYGKGLVGLGSSSLNPSLTATTTYPSGFKGATHSFAVALGAGVDYRLTRKISVRLADVEYQQWFTHINIPDKKYSPTFHPYGVSAGLSYRIF